MGIILHHSHWHFEVTYLLGCAKATVGFWLPTSCYAYFLDNETFMHKRMTYL